MNVDGLPARLDRRALRRVDAALEVLDHVLAAPRGAALRSPAVLDAIAIARGVKPSVPHRLYADLWLHELLAEHRALLADALERERSAVRAHVLASETRRG